ncbi:MAG: hypothetical protein M1834_004632 [Cirrosporium novae-zelandiae]|nr:MAG: hypothetical protein M1834_004632 [Cirrosporium novae-zelandiae]
MKILQSNALVLGLLFVLLTLSKTSNGFSCNLADADEKPRIFVLSDISNEPDDTQSMVRLLLHSDQLDIQGLVATTSYWLNSSTHADQIHAVIDGYAKVYNNLKIHGIGQYPTPKYLKALVRSGPSVYGMASISDEGVSEGAQLLIDAVESSSKPLWVQVWGGAAVLGEALNRIQRARTEKDTKNFMSRLRVYSISDQDDVGVWIRREFPSVFYLSSVHGWNQYGLALWTGISGEGHYGFDKGGPDTELVTNEWVKKNIQIGPLGSLYPDIMFIMEGDSPALLYTLQNGLNAPEHPSWGGWGGRYTPTSLSGKSQHYADTVDRVTGKDGRLFLSNHATIWRWREAFQNEFAARIQWTLTKDYQKTPHPPSVVVNASCSNTPLEMRVCPGSRLVFDASQSQDPLTGTHESLIFKWWQYRDITATQWSVEHEVPELKISFAESDPRNLVATIEIPSIEEACRSPKALHASSKLQRVCQSYHLILEVKNGGDIPLTRYRRMVFNVINDSKCATEGSHDEL